LQLLEKLDGRGCTEGGEASEDDEDE